MEHRPDKSAASALLAGLDRTTARLVRRGAAEIQGLLRRSAENILLIGRRLIEIRDLLTPHRGLWEKWLASEFGWSDQTGRRFIHVAQEYTTKQQIVAYAPSALYLLSAPSTPQDARDEAEALAEAGEAITAQRAKEIIAGKRKPAEVMAELSPEEQEELLALTSKHYERKAEARAAAVPTPEDADRTDVVMVKKHLELACKRLEALLERSNLEPPEKHNAATKLLKLLQAELACPLFR